MERLKTTDEAIEEMKRKSLRFRFWYWLYRHFPFIDRLRHPFRRDEEWGEVGDPPEVDDDESFDGETCPLCGDWVPKDAPCRRRKAAGV